MACERGPDSLHVAHLHPVLVCTHSFPTCDYLQCLDILCPSSLNIAVYVEGKVAARLKECSAAIVARHLNTEEEVLVRYPIIQLNVDLNMKFEFQIHQVEGLGLPSPLVPDVKAWVAWMQHIHTYTL